MDSNEKTEADHPQFCQGKSLKIIVYCSRGNNYARRNCHLSNKLLYN